jgi:hypothetical protein
MSQIQGIPWARRFRDGDPHLSPHKKLFKLVFAKFYFWGILRAMAETRILPKQTQDKKFYGPHRPVSGQIIDVPVPVPHDRGAIREAMYRLLASMEVGQCLEVDRTLYASRRYVYAFRVQFGRELRFKIRPTRSNTTRIWRVA